MSSIDTRNLERESMFLMADLVVEGADPGTAERVKVRNLSSEGMMVQTVLRLKRGTRVAVELRNIGPVAGVVVWARGTRLGVTFVHEIDPKLARTQVYSGDKEAPGYARATLDAPSHDGWNGKLRRI